MNQLAMMKVIREELSTTGEDITIDNSTNHKAYKESRERFEEFKNLVRRIGELARKA